MGGRGKGKKLPHFKVRRPDDKVFGRKKALSRTKLPIYSEVGSALIFEAENHRLERELKENSLKLRKQQVFATCPSLVFCFLQFATSSSTICYAICSLLSATYYLPSYHDP